MNRKIIYALVILLAAVPVMVVAVHILAVGGIYMYSRLKAGNPGVPEIKQTTSPAGDTGEIYTVAKGDTPVMIAKKLHVSCNDLLELNKITDPGKLQIGQKLLVPARKKLTDSNPGIRALQIHVS